MTSSLLKKSQASARQGKNGRKSAVYTLVHEHFEAILNAVSCRLGLFQHAARAFIVCCVLLLASVAAAIDTGKAFDDPELQARYEKIISEVRCLQCQNQSIKDSNVLLASDLRREIRRMISEGKTDGEVADFLVERYGEFALYRPRASGKTLLLWLAPFLLVVFGGVAIVRIVRHRMTLPIDDEVEEGRTQ